MDKDYLLKEFDLTVKEVCQELHKRFKEWYKRKGHKSAFSDVESYFRCSPKHVHVYVYDSKRAGSRKVFFLEDGYLIIVFREEVEGLISFFNSEADVLRFLRRAEKFV